MKKGHGFAGQVRRCIQQFSGRKVFSASMIARILGEPSAARVQTAFRDFLRRGEIVKLAPGQYRHTGEKELWCKPAVARPRVLRAMHISQRFTAGGLVMLTDATKNFIYKLIRELLADGAIVKLGERKNPKEPKEGVYGLKNSDEFYLKYVLQK